MGKKGRRLFDEAKRRYERERGLDEKARWIYFLTDLEQPPASAFLRSQKSGTQVYLTGRNEGGSLLTLVFVVASLRPVRCPDEERTLGEEVVRYYPNADLVGRGLIRERRGGRLTVVNRVRFDLERLADDQPDLITGGFLVLDYEPGSR